MIAIVPENETALRKVVFLTFPFSRHAYDPQKHHRRSIRLKGYDYTQPGAYYITICTEARQCLFGTVVKGQMRLNLLGYIARFCWSQIPAHFPHIQLDTYIIMPDHIHGILVIIDDTTVGTRQCPLVST